MDTPPGSEPQDAWLEQLLRQAHPCEADPTLSAQDAAFTLRVLAALPAAQPERLYRWLLPLVVLLGTVSIALWHLTQRPIALAVEHPAALWSWWLPVAVLYWCCWETCFAAPRAAH